MWSEFDINPAMIRTAEGKAAGRAAGKALVKMMDLAMLQTCMSSLSGYRHPEANCLSNNLHLAWFKQPRCQAREELACDPHRRVTPEESIWAQNRSFNVETCSPRPEG